MYKSDLTRKIKIKLGNFAQYDDITSVVNVLVDELGEEIKTGKKISISNFGKFQLRTYPSKPHIDFQTGEMKMSSEYSLIRFMLASNYKKYLKLEKK